MEHRNNIISDITRRLPIAVLIAVLLTVSSCDRQERVPEKVFFSMLREIHMTTGLLSFTDIKEKYSAKDSITIYSEIYGRYGYTHEEVENTFHYYFIEKNNKLKSFYDSFLGELTAEQARLVEEKLAEINRLTRDRWTDKESYSFPDEEPGERVYFEHQMIMPGVYTISFDITVEPSDQSIGPCLSVWVRPFGRNREDEEPVEVTTIKYVKDGNNYHFSVPVNKEERTVTLLYGYLYDSDADSPVTGKSAYIREISIDHVPR